MVSFRGLFPPEWVLDGVTEGRIAAICLFAYNVASPAQLRGLTDSLHEAARRGRVPPPLIGIDQEGGQLMAVTGGTTELPGNMALGATRSPELAEKAGRLLGLELLALGCNMNFAPVLDLAGHLESAVVGTRAFGDEPGRVAELGAALIRGMQSTGVVATAKHFPGHGDTALDSHHLAPVVARKREQLSSAELVPFRAAIAAGVGAVMGAHVRYPHLDDRPATLSKAVMSDLLRTELGFEGLAVTDAMDMAAVADGPAELRAREALDAGADLVMLGHLPDQAELLRALEPHYRRASLERIAGARRRLPRDLPRLESIGNGRGLAQEIADRAVTLVRGSGQLPLRLEPEERLGLILPRVGDLTPADSSSRVELRLPEQLRARHPNLEVVEDGNGPFALTACGAVIVATSNAVSDDDQREVVEKLSQSGVDLIHLVVRSPADALITPPHVPCVCTYGIRAANTEAAVRVLFGEMEPTGVLPVRLPERKASIA